MKKSVQTKGERWVKTVREQEDVISPRFFSMIFWVFNFFWWSLPLFGILWKQNVAKPAYQLNGSEM